CFRCREVLLTRHTPARAATLVHYTLGFFSRVLIIKQDARSRIHKHAHYGGADATRSAGNNSDSIFKRQHDAVWRHADYDTERAVFLATNELNSLSRRLISWPLRNPHSSQTLWQQRFFLDQSPIGPALAFFHFWASVDAAKSWSSAI